MKKAALYIRVSTDAQREEGYSIDAQKEMLVGYCKSKNITNYEFYIDGGFTGSNIERPEMERLIKNVKKGNVDCVVVYKLDRLSRSQKDTLFLIEDVFNPHHVDFISLNENMDTSTPIGRAMLGIMSAFAQLERETIRERTRMGMKERVKLGYWMGGGKIPFGYSYDKNKGILVPNQDAEKVRQIYYLYIEGYSADRIAKLLNLKYDKLVNQILTRRTNLGYIVYNGVEYKGQHEPIIAEETYDKAMEIMEGRTKRKTPYTDYLLTGLVYCGVCGNKMRYQKWGKAGVKIYCYSQQKSKPNLIKDPSCDNKKVWANEVEEVVLNDMFQLSFKNIAKTDEGKYTNPLKMLENQKENTTAKIKRLYNLYAESENDILLDTIDENKKLLEKLNKQIKQEKSKSVTSKKIKESLDRIKNLKDTWDYMTVKERQDVVHSLIEKVVITNNKVDIFYKF